MGTDPIDPERVMELKREARELQKARRLKAKAARDHIARREGFNSWKELVNAAGGKQALRDAQLNERPRKRRRP